MLRQIPWRCTKLIDKDEIEQLSNIFVTRAEWDKSVDKTTAEVADLKRDIAVLGTKLTYLIGILGAIAVPILGIAVKLIFNFGG